jgi:hypothetical protein
MKGQMLTKLQFIYFYALFLFFVIQIGSMAGYTIVKNAPPAPTIPPEPTILDYITYPIANIGYFFKLMMTSSDYFLFGALILTPFIVAMLWVILEFVRGI